MSAGVARRSSVRDGADGEGEITGIVFSLVLSSSARRSLSSGLPPEAAFAGFEFIEGPLRRRPRIVGAPLKAPFEGFWRARRGEYRIRYRTDESRHVVEVVAIDHRCDAYRS